MQNTTKIIFSRAWDLIKPDLTKIWKGLLISLAGAAIAFLGQVSGIIDYTQMGVYGPIVALAVGSVASALVNTLRKYISATTYIAQ